MQRFLKLITTLFACLFLATHALAHAFLDKAIPGVGATVSGSPSELELQFSQDIVPAFSSVQLADAAGAAISVSKATLEPGKANTLHVRLNHALKSGTYVVSWHVVSVDTHPTSGTYKFTVAP